MVKSFDVRKYVIPITRYAKVAPKHERTKKAVSVIRNFVLKHTRANKILLGEELNRLMWAHSIEYPPRKVKVFVQKLSDGVFVNLEGAPLRVEKKPEPVKKEDKKEKSLEQITDESKKEEKKEEPKKEEAAKPEKKAATKPKK